MLALMRTMLIANFDLNALRVPRRQVFTLADLVEVGMIPQAAAPVLEGLVRRRAAFLVSGGTGSPFKKARSPASAGLPSKVMTSGTAPPA